MPSMFNLIYILKLIIYSFNNTSFSQLEAYPVITLIRKKKFKKYSSPIPGNRVQVDTYKISPGIYQYTAIEDCYRWESIKNLYKSNSQKYFRF